MHKIVTTHKRNWYRSVILYNTLLYITTCEHLISVDEMPKILKIRHVLSFGTIENITVRGVLLRYEYFQKTIIEVVSFDVLTDRLLLF